MTTAPPQLKPQAPRTPPRPPVRTARRWPRRLLIGANVFVAVCVLAAGAGYAYFRVQFGRIPTVGGLAKALRNQGDDDPGKPMNVLLVGSDTRATLSADDEESFGSAAEAGGQRSDTIIVLRADPTANKAAMLSIPRDLYVPIAGGKGSDRINSAFSNGPLQLIATIREALGIEIDHYVQVDFNGFRGIVEAVGGVPVYVPAPARDPVTGLDIPKAGCITLNGEEALGYVRSRKYEYLEGGKWHDDPTGDIGRIGRQQDFIRRAMKKSIQKGARNPATLNALIGTGVRNVKIDDKFTSRDILRLGNRFRSLEPDAVETLSVPGVSARADGKSVLKLKQPEAQEVLDRFNGKIEPPPAATPDGGPAAPAVLPSSIRVRVLNGSGVTGQATEASAALQSAGYNVAGAGDADSRRYTRPVVRYGAGQKPKALVLQSQVKGGADVKEDLAIRGVDIVLVTGSQFTGIAAERSRAAADVPAPAAATTVPKADAKEATPQPQC